MYSFGLTCLSYNKQKSQGSSSLPRALQVGGVTIDKEIGKGGIQYSFFFFHLQSDTEEPQFSRRRRQNFHRVGDNFGKFFRVLNEMESPFCGTRVKRVQKTKSKCPRISSRAPKL